MLIRAAFGIALALATCLLFTAPGRRAVEQPAAFTLFRVLFVASRLMGWAVAYVVLADFTRFTDLVLYYYPEAALAFSGRIPYIDFPSSYGPVFPYLSGALLPVWDSPAAVALVMVLLEIGAVLALAGALRRDPHLPATASCWVLAVYLLNPASLYWSGMMAYNSSVILLCWVMAARLVVNGRFGASTAWLAASVAAGKFLGVIVAPLWVIHPARRYGVMVVAAAAAATAWLVARQFGADLALPLIREGNRSTAGNLWFLAGGLLPLSQDSAVWRYGSPLALLGVAGGLGVWLALKWREAPAFQQVAAAVSSLGWLFLVTSKKSYPHYAPMFLLMSVVALCDGRAGTWRWALLLALVGAVGLVEPGLWNALGQPQSLAQVTGNQAVLPLIGADVVLVVGAATLAVASARVAGARA